MLFYFLLTSVRLPQRKIWREFPSRILSGTRGSLTIFFLSLLLGLLLYPMHSEALAAHQENSGTGEIIVVSTLASTIAVEVMLNNRPHIIGGKLAADAILLRKNQKCDLNDFQVGEIVTIMSDNPPPKRQNPDRFSVIETKRSEKPDEATYTGGRPFPLTPTTTMVGLPHHHVISPKETLLDIARLYDLGYNEIKAMYPDYDPWMPPVGKRLLLPTQRLLPDADRKGIVINVPEMRLYYYRGSGEKAEVVTHPVGIGDTDFQTEPGRYTVGNKAINPTWYIPPSLREKYQVTSIPPGPDNPLGQYWLGLKNTNYGIHGSDIPWSVGRKVTHGCIRMYPEDISTLFDMVPVGTPVEIVYEPVKTARIGTDIYIEVHSDIYNTLPDLVEYARGQIIQKGYWMEVDRKKFQQALMRSHGIPENITFGLRLATDSDL